MQNINWNLFEGHLQTLIKKENIPGAAVAVAQNGEIIYQKGFGVSDIITKQPVTPDTIFGIASITKSFTAMVIMQLAKQGMLSVNDPVTNYLPEFKVRGREDLNSIKIHHLLTHTTGLPPMKRREELNKFDEHLEYLATEQYELLGKPGEYFSYCNDTFLLLGAIIERLTGRLFRRYVTEQVLTPLNMNRSTFSLEEVSKFHNVSVPYEWNMETKKLECCSWPALGNYEVGGGIRSTVIDLLKYGHRFVGNRSSNDTPILNKEDLREMWNSVHRVGRNSFYGYGLKMTPHYSNLTLVEHGGSQPGVSSHFGFVPEKQLVAAVLTNGSAVSVSEIWLAAINTALGLPIEKKRSIEPHYEASFQELQRFVGTYRTEEQGELTILLDEDTLKAESGGRQFDLRASGPDTLVMKNKDEPIRFFFKNRNQPWAALFGSRMYRRLESCSFKEVYPSKP
jgi:CubicO group peptidase (beta-lactamase class C family)